MINKSLFDIKSLSFNILFIIIFSGCQSKKQVQPDHGIPVSAIKVKAQKIPANFEYVGVAESSHIIQMRARVEGYLQSINYKEGTMVKTGDLLFVIDQRPFIAALEKAQAELERQKAILWNVEQIRTRMVALYDQNAISERDLDNALADELAAKAAVMAQEAAVYQADLNLGFASIRAPDSAMAGQAKYREGALIAPGEQNLLTNLYVIDPIWVNFSISDRDLLIAKQQVAMKQLIWPENQQFTVEAVLSDGTIVPSQGYIDFTSPAIQQNTGTMLIRSVFQNNKHLIYPGQFVRAIVKGAYRPNCIIVPQTAILQAATGSCVYVIGSDNIAERRDVVLGDWFYDYWIVLDGIKDGEIVVVEGVSRLRNQASVEVIEYVPDYPSVDATSGTQGNRLGF